MLHLPPLTVIVASLLGLVIGITIHEFGHAWTAHILGDNTARDQGRISLNPMAHLEPLGALMLLLMTLGAAPIGWGRPVPVNPYRLRGGRRGMALVSLAGPAANLLLAFCVALPFRLSPVLHSSFSEETLLIARAIILLNIALAAFNLIPIPPLDGFGVLMGIVPKFWVPVLAPIQQYGFAILLILIFFGRGVLGSIMSPVMALFATVVVGRGSMLF